MCRHRTLILMLIAAASWRGTTVSARAATVDDQTSDHTVLFDAPRMQSQSPTDEPATRAQRDPVNPVPLSPQLGTALMTLAGVVVYRHRRPLLKWLA